MICLLDNGQSFFVEGWAIQNALKPHFDQKIFTKFGESNVDSGILDDSFSLGQIIEI